MWGLEISELTDAQAKEFKEEIYMITNFLKVALPIFATVGFVVCMASVIAIVIGCRKIKQRHQYERINDY